MDSINYDWFFDWSINMKMIYKKCKHDKCRRKAVENGFCDKCIQLNTKECNFCSNSKNKLFMVEKKGVRLLSRKEEESFKMPKPKHNKWIDGFTFGEKFFKWISIFGWGLIVILLIYTSLIFWADFIIRYPKLLGIGDLFLRVLELGVIFFVGGTLFRWLCYFTYSLLYNKELKRLEKEGEKKYGNKGSIK